MPFRPASIVIHPDVEEAYARLEAAAKRGKKPQSSIWKGFITAVARIRADGQWGEVVPGSEIPAHFVETYGVTNLYCVDLPDFHRAFYTIRNRDIVFLELVDHAEYDRLFGRKRK